MLVLPAQGAQLDLQGLAAAHGRGGTVALFPVAQVPVTHAQIGREQLDRLDALEQQGDRLSLEGFIKAPSFCFRFHRLGLSYPSRCPSLSTKSSQAQYPGQESIRDVILFPQLKPK